MRVARVAPLCRAPARGRVCRPAGGAVEGPGPAAHPRVVAARWPRPGACVLAAVDLRPRGRASPGRAGVFGAPASRGVPRGPAARGCGIAAHHAPAACRSVGRSARQHLGRRRARERPRRVQMGAVLQRQVASPVRRPQHLRARAPRVRPRGACRSPGRDGPLLGRAARRGAAHHHPGHCRQLGAARRGGVGVAPERRARRAPPPASGPAGSRRAKARIPARQRPPRLDARPGGHHRLSRAVPAVRRVALAGADLASGVSPQLHDRRAAHAGRNAGRRARHLGGAPGGLPPRARGLPRRLARRLTLQRQALRAGARAAG